MLLLMTELFAKPNPIRWVYALLLLASFFRPDLVGGDEVDHVRQLQESAVTNKRAAWGHWGPEPDRYNAWFQHSNRLIPIYTFGIDLSSVNGAHSAYRTASRIEALYDHLPETTLNPEAEYFDQTQVYDLQKTALAAGKKYVILLVFDGMDWQTTWAAATYAAGEVAYRAGRGTGLSFQDYRGTTTDFGYFVTSPHNTGTEVDVDRQLVKNPGGTLAGGYDWQRGGAQPWDAGNDPRYIIAASRERRQAFTDSSSSASSMTAGIKTYNNAINLDYRGQQVETIAHQLQSKGFSIGVVTSVPISHATPACAYSHNVSRDDFQDLTRDLVGLPSIAHPAQPLRGVDVLLGAGAGETLEADAKQGLNFVPGNKYITDEDLRAIDVRHGGAYRVVTRASGVDGSEALTAAAREAGAEGHRLFGMFGNYPGAGGSHLPFRTADGAYNPTIGGRGLAEQYSHTDLTENPTLADMTTAALHVLEQNETGFWLLVEAGDVDWANHDNNIDNSIGAVLDGDAAFRTLVDWVERRDAWNETAILVTADHGHYLVLTQPEALAGPSTEAP